MRTPFSFTLSFTDWSAANGFDSTLPATRDLWNKEALGLYGRIKSRPSKSEDDLALRGEDAFEVPRHHGARA